jgi:hypothetical protein
VVRAAACFTYARSTVWVMGGSTFPTPTQINKTSDNISLSAKAECKAGAGSTPSEKKVSVWKTQPALVNGIYTPLPDASYKFTLSCAACTRAADTDG